MARFLASQLQYLQFLAGLGMIASALACMMLHRRGNREVPWKALGIACATMGMATWTMLLAQLLHAPAWLAIGHLSLEIAAALALLEFARQGLATHTPSAPRWWVLLTPLVVIVPVALLEPSVLDRLIHAGLTLPSSAAAAICLILSPRPGSRRRWYIAAALSLVAGGALSLLGECPATRALLTDAALHESIHSLVHLPHNLPGLVLAACLLRLAVGEEPVPSRQGHPPRPALFASWGLRLSVLAALAVGWGLAIWLDATVYRHSLRHQALTLDNVRQTLHQHLRSADRMAAAIANAPATVAALTETLSPAAAQDMLVHHAALAPDAVCYLMDRRGMTKASSNHGQRLSFVGRAYPDRQYFIDALAGRPGRAFAVGMTSRQPGYYASAPVYGPNKSIVGVAVVKSQIDPMPVADPQLGITLLIDPHGVILLSNRPELRHRALWPLTQQTRSDLLRTRAFAAIHDRPLFDRPLVPGQPVRLRHNDMNVCSLPVVVPGWTLVSLEPDDTTGLARLLGMGIALLLLIVVVGQYWLHQRSALNALALHASERRHNSLLQGSPNRIETLDAQARIVSINPAGLSMMAWTDADALGQPLAALWKGPSLVTVEHAFAQALAGRRVTFHASAMRSDGREIHLDGVFTPIVSDSGSTDHVLAVYNDVTHRHLAELEVRKLAMVAARTSNGVVIASAQGRIEWVNDGFTRIHGRAPDEVLGRDLLDAHEGHGSDTSTLTPCRKRLLAGEPFALELLTRHKDGHEFWLAMQAEPVRDPAGHVTHIIAIESDVTERKTAELALREREESLSVMLRGIGDALIATDAQGRVLRMNPEAQRLTGWTQEEACGQLLAAVVSLIDDRTGDAVASPVEQAMRLARTVEAPGDTLLVSRDGRTTPIAASASPIRSSPDGPIAGVVLVFRDHTSERDRQQVLDDTARQQQALVRIVTHPAAHEGDFTAISRLVTESAAHALHADRMSIWLLSDDRQTLRCVDLCDVTINSHRADPPLAVASFPDYFASLATERAVAIDDVAADPRARELRALDAGLGQARSTLGAPIRIAGAVVGVIFAEHVRQAIPWRSHQVRFAAELADQMAHALTHAARRQAERDLVDSRALLAEAMDAARLAHWEYDPSDGCFVLNDAYCRLIHHADAAALGGHRLTAAAAASLIHPDDRPAVASMLRDAIDTDDPGFTRAFPCRAMRADGSVAHVTVRCHVVKDDHGRTVRIRGSSQDVTDQRIAEHLLHLSRFSIEHASDAVVWIRGDGHIHYVNAAACERLGYSRHELEAMSVSDLDPDFDSAAWPRHWEQLRQLGRMVFETKHRARDGRLIPVEVSANFTVFDGQEYNFAFVRDITERERAQEQLRMLSIAVEQSPASVVITDTEGRIEYVNPKFVQLTGYSPREVLGQNPRLLKSGETPIEEYRRLWETISNGREWHGLFHNRKRNGDLYWECASISPIRDASGHIRHYVAVKEDITDRKQAEEALRRSEERYALAERGANDGLWDWDLRTDQIYFSPRSLSLLGFERAEDVPTPWSWFQRIDPADLPQFQADLAMHLAGRSAQFQSEHRVAMPDGQMRWLLCRAVAVRTQEGGTARIAGSISDITTRRLAEEQLREAAQTDRLTGLPNRTTLHERLNRVSHFREHRPDHRYAVLFLDFDRFKIINDTLGHEVGDLMLTEIARRLREALSRQGDRADSAIAGRLGGDEFVILLDGLRSPEAAMQCAQSLLTVLSRPYQLNGHEVHSSVSIGVTTSDISHGRAEELVRDADIAMYEAKAAGPGQAVMFSRSMQTDLKDMSELEADLRKAIERDQLLLHYQPIIALDTGRLLGFEALLRWRHPQRGLVPPAHFIPLAEETSLILPLGEWTLRRAASQLSEWCGQFGVLDGLTMNVNLSRHQLRQPGLVDSISRALRESQAPHRGLQLEITESTFMVASEEHRRSLQSIRDLGVRLAMDDFGTGYSSLSCLHQFPLDSLKIDRMFITNMDTRSDYAAVVNAIISLAHNLGVSVTAEGVESAEHVAALQALECDQAQGFYFGHPMAAPEAAEFIRRSFSLHIPA